MPRPDGLTIGPFTPDAIDGAGRLLADRHRLQRLIEPASRRPTRMPRPRGPRSPRSPRSRAPPGPSPIAATSSSAISWARRARRRGAPTSGSRAPATRSPSPRPSATCTASPRAAGSRRVRPATTHRAGDRRRARRGLVQGGVRAAARPRDPRGAGRGRAFEVPRRTDAPPRGAPRHPGDGPDRRLAARAPGALAGVLAADAADGRGGRRRDRGGLRRPGVHDVRRRARRARSSAPRSAARSSSRPGTAASSGRTTPGSSGSRPCCRRRAGSAPGGRSARRSSPGRGTRATRRSSPTGARRTWVEPGVAAPRLPADVPAAVPRDRLGQDARPPRIGLHARLTAVGCGFRTGRLGCETSTGTRSDARWCGRCGGRRWPACC